MTAAPTATPTPLLFSPASLGRLSVRNRVVMAPVDSVFRTEDGGSNEQHKTYLAARARGGVGLIIADNTVVRWPEGSVGSKSLRIDQDRFIPSLGEVVDEVHRYDAVIAAQINHAGRQTTLGGSQGIELVSASAIAWQDSGTVPRELTREEIALVRADFVASAKRAAKAGFDAVQVHAAHGYLLSSFLSPALNQRADEYGGSVENRTRLVREIISEIQDVLPDLPILVRMNCVDGIPGGIEENESIDIAVLLTETGIDGLDVSAGTYESSGLTFPPMMRGEGHIMSRIRKIRNAVRIPVIGVGRIVRPETAEKYLANGSVDFIALGRALIADPNWAIKAQRGESPAIRHCIGCNHGCIHRIDMDLTMKCNVNPDVGQEGRDRTAEAKHKKHIVVVGAGPAGIEFSLRAAKSGHRVELFDRSGQVGGQLIHAQVPEFKKDLGSLRDFFEHELTKSSVELHLGSEVTAEDIETSSPDLVVLATGADPVSIGQVLTESEMPAFTFADVLGGTAVLEGPITVVGGGPNGCETAVYLAQRGFTVTVIEMGDAFVPRDDHSIRDWVTNAFAEHGIDNHLNTRITAARDGKVSVLREIDNRSFDIPTGTLVSAAGMRPRRDLHHEIAASSVRVELIGDARSVGTILDATERAAWLAERLITE